MVIHRFVVKQNISNYRFKVQKPQLSHLDIELTERCNNSCFHCYINLPANHRSAKRRELTTAQWKDILRQAVDLGALTVRFTGGEPLLREDFIELYLYTRHLGLKVMLFTNARLITEELADLFVKVPPLKKIEISVYGMRPESYDAVARTRGAFVEYYRGVNYLLNRKIPFVVKSVLLPPNRGELVEFETWAATIPWMDKNPSYAAFLDFRARRDSPAKNRLINSLRITPEESLALLTRDEDSYRKGMIDFCSRFLRPPGDMLFTCGAGEAGCVDAYGIYQMCMMLRHPDTIYDLTQGTLREAHSDVFPRYQKLRATNQEYLARCARCFLKGLCEQCPAKSWTEHGTLDTPVEYNCQLAHSQAHFLGLIGENERAWEVVEWKDRISRLVKMAETKIDSQSLNI